MNSPTVTSFVGTFLKPEMWHVYNQVHGLRRFKSIVVTRERRYEGLFPHGGVHLLHSYPMTLWDRIRLKYLGKEDRSVYTGSIPSLAQQLDGLGTDLLHIYFGHEGTRLAPLLLHWEKPVVVSFHGADLGTYVRRPKDVVWLPTLFGKARRILARCDYFVPYLEELGCPREKIRINRTHVLTDFFRPVARPWPSDGAFNLMQACRFIPKKGLLTTVRAFAEFRKAFPKAALFLAGDGPQMGALMKEIWALDLTRHVHFTGFLDRGSLRDLFGQCHFFLHPSDRDSGNDIEGIPNALVEAMATGLPSFSTPHAGIPEVIDDGKNGFMVEVGDHAGLAERLVALATDETACRAIAEAGAKRVHDGYNPGLQIAKLEEIYAEAMAR
jgi:colanic acid/amylovoran biosynthesis glycosyltransferase